ncbi:hypothetical protein L2E82_16102 [Cichorium intybus]|uniref:Uncharacterized protein n=1 Tax=Cichorium intybus TaxID=13427 RepID=A0ACB9F4M4_CICIN|nr:hypothetical protein L2E82_16102 [Cichorium intybus]
MNDSSVWTNLVTFDDSTCSVDIPPEMKEQGKVSFNNQNLHAITDSPMPYQSSEKLLLLLMSTSDKVDSSLMKVTRSVNTSCENSIYRSIKIYFNCEQACVSLVDINIEETLNSLKYANRAWNIQNKPMVSIVAVTMDDACATKDTMAL